MHSGITARFLLFFQLYLVFPMMRRPQYSRLLGPAISLSPDISESERLQKTPLVSV